MLAITRRSVLSGLSALGLPIPVHATPPEALKIDADGGAVELSRYPADSPGKRPAVLLLHGGRGIELDPRAYERHAIALATGGSMHSSYATSPPRIGPRSTVKPTHPKRSTFTARAGFRDGWVA